MVRTRMPAGMAPGLSPFLRNILVFLVVLYVTQVLLESWMGLPITALVALWAPMGPAGETGMFHFWQPVSSLLFNGSPLSAALDWLMLYFFLPPTLDFLGRRGTAKLLASTWVLGILVGFALAWGGIVLGAGPCIGVSSLVTVMIVVFGMARPNAQILVFFVLPLRGMVLVWLELALLVLLFLYARSLESAVALATCLAAIAWMWSNGSVRTLLLKLRLRWLQRQQEASRRRAHSRFDVIEGGRSDEGRRDKDDWVH
jgi:membrane associated rhomboid family serine protease